MISIEGMNLNVDDRHTVLLRVGPIDATVAGVNQSRARRRNCRHSNWAPTGPEAPAKAGSSGPTKMQELAGNGSPPSTAASPASTSQNWPPPALGARPTIAVPGGIR